MRHEPAPIALVTHSYFDEDPRLRREADALVATGRAVDVIALRRPGEPERAVVGGASVTRLDVQRHQGAGIATYLREYLSFFARAGARLVLDQPRRHYGLVQVATLPDWLVFAALPLRAVGVPVVLDLHEAMPEFFASRFPRLAGGLAWHSLMAAERLSIAMASHVLTANNALRERLLGLGVRPDRISVVPNVPSLARFDEAGRARRFMEDGTLRLIYAGALTPTYELPVAIDAIASVRRQRPALPVTLDVYGRGDAADALREQAHELGLDSEVTLHGRAPLEAIPAALARADVGLAPVSDSAFTRLSFSTKLLEYGAMRLPIVTARLPLAEQLLGPEAVAFYEPGNAESMATAILGVVDEPDARDRRLEVMGARVGIMSWETEQARYVALINRLASGEPPPAPGSEPSPSS